MREAILIKHDVLTATTRAQIRYLWYGNDVHLLAWGKGRHPEHEPSPGRSTSACCLQQVAGSKPGSTIDVRKETQRRVANTIRNARLPGPLASLPFRAGQCSECLPYYFALRPEAKGASSSSIFHTGWCRADQGGPAKPPAMTALANQRAGAALALAWISSSFYMEPSG